MSWRTKDRVAPHNLYVNLAKIQTLYDYTPNARQPWKFDAQCKTTQTARRSKK